MLWSWLMSLENSGICPVCSCSLKIEDARPRVNESLANHTVGSLSVHTSASMRGVGSSLCKRRLFRRRQYLQDRCCSRLFVLIQCILLVPAATPSSTRWQPQPTFQTCSRVSKLPVSQRLLAGALASVPSSDLLINEETLGPVSVFQECVTLPLPS
ncbi:hypothetical protein DFJ58DRAFT_782093 [Suillus subalutaceus]|uniref:uncharacterized protein n=1 Tax=Suillus subalutaceus TaxID=48586 RepID=UPI001B865CDE|nr:uncharacterized protein DFJ58DRAFT_782093 [Suillus subalutaceus]KAG1858408.1 hypothetical protein DFJ58DRAFT_782093 [Suillus subalutaceus]